MASDTGNTKPFAIAGRMVRERERLLGMSDIERAWRKQYLKDQILTNHEPIIPENYYRERYNPIRRFYRAPLEKVQVLLTPAIGARNAFLFRFWSGKIALGMATIYAGCYYFKYNTNDWTRKGGWRVIQSRSAVIPGDANFPQVSDRTVGADYAARGFKDAPI